jgi:hypothetical protein
VVSGSSDGEQQLLGAVDARFAAGLAFVLAGIRLDALSVGAAADADAGLSRCRLAASTAATMRSFVTDGCALMPSTIMMVSEERIAGEPGGLLSLSSSGLARFLAPLSLTDGARIIGSRKVGREAER